MTTVAVLILAAIITGSLVLLVAAIAIAGLTARSAVKALGSGSTPRHLR
jgi:hypothetical protein